LSLKLRVNFHKSQVGTMGISIKDLKVLAKCLNCRMISLPFKEEILEEKGYPIQ